MSDLWGSLPPWFDDECAKVVLGHTDFVSLRGVQLRCIEISELSIGRGAFWPSVRRELRRPILKAGEYTFKEVNVSGYTFYLILYSHCQELHNTFS